MKKPIFAGFALSVVLSAPSVFADAGGSCHFHGNQPATEATVGNCASQRRDALVKSGKIEASWNAVKPDKIEVTEGQKGKEWKVMFKDTGAKDKRKETLYMFFTLPGNFIAANFTGQ